MRTEDALHDLHHQQEDHLHQDFELRELLANDIARPTMLDIDENMDKDAEETGGKDPPRA